MSYTISTKYGTGIGKIYITDSNNNIVCSFPNNKKGKEKADRVLLASASVIGETLATATLTYTGGAGTTTDLTINSVSIFNTGTAITGASTTALATATATAINAFTSSPNFTAQALGEIVYIFIEPGFGSDNNGDVLSATVTGTLTVGVVNLDGGTSSRNTVDSQTGFKIYLNLSASAPSGDITGASDVSDFIVRKPYNSPNSTFDYVISSDTISVARKSVLTEVRVDTEGAVASDNLKDIIPLGFNNGDWLIIRGLAGAREVTIIETGNINLSNSVTFITGDNSYVIALEYIDGDFFEIFRSPTVPFTVTSLRASDFPQGVLGVQDIELTAGGGTVSLDPNVDEGIIRITGSAVTLTSSWTIEGSGTPNEGDKFFIYIDQEVTLNGNNVTIFGIPLTELQALSTQASGSKPFILGQYVTAWRGTLILNSQGRDLVDAIQLATKENLLGVPILDGQVLASLVDGTRYWVDLPVGSFGNNRLNVRKNMTTVPGSAYMPKSIYGDSLTGGTTLDTLDDYEAPTTETGIFSAGTSFNIATGVFTAPETGYYAINLTANLRIHSSTAIPFPFRSDLAPHRSQNTDGYWMKKTPVSSITGDFAITAVAVSPANTITIAGDYTDTFTQLTSFYINGSTGKDGLYVVASSVLSGGDTVITIDVINSTAGSITNATADGNVISVLNTRAGSIAFVIGLNSVSQETYFTYKEVVTDKTSFLRIYGTGIVFLNSGTQLIVGYSNNTDLDYFGGGGSPATVALQFIKIDF